MTTIKLNSQFSLIKGTQAPQGKEKVLSSLLKFMDDQELERYVVGDSRGYVDYLMRGKNHPSTRSSFCSAMLKSGIVELEYERFTIFKN